MASKREAILAALAASHVPLTAEALRRAVGGDASRVNTTLLVLLKVGAVVRAVALADIPEGLVLFCDREGR